MIRAFISDELNLTFNRLNDIRSDYEDVLGCIFMCVFVTDGQC